MRSQAKTLQKSSGQALRQGFPRLRSGQAGQVWDIFLFLFFILTVLFGVSYFFVYKFGGIPVIRANRDFGPTERGVLPRGTFPFRPLSPERSDGERVSPQPPQRIERRPVNSWLTLFIPRPTQAATTRKTKPSTLSRAKRTLVPILETTITAPTTTMVTLETNTLTVRFDGRNPGDPQDRLFFETFLFPLERQWVKTYGRSRSFNRLARGHYTFFVRARNQKGFTDPSPAFFNLDVRVSAAFGRVSFSIGSPTQVSLGVSGRDPIKVSGWRISSLSGTSIIPPAVRSVDSHLSNTVQEIVLEPGQRLFLHAGDSPFGIDFRTNRCFSFFPSNIRTGLNNRCRSFSPDELFAIRRRWPVSDRCLQLIQSHACSAVSDRELQSVEREYNCQRFLQNELTYRGCYERHHNDSDFLGNDWHVYIPTEQFRFSRYDIISLYDQAGFLVARQRIF